MFTDGEVISMLRNSGVDVDCGACMEVAFTGATTNVHSCAQRTTEKAAVVAARSIFLEVARCPRCESCSQSASYFLADHPEPKP